MKKNQLTYGLVAFVLLLLIVYYFVNKQAGEGQTTGGNGTQTGGNGGGTTGGNCQQPFTKTISLKRGIQNNNWGNIKRNPNNNWQGKVPEACNTDNGKTFEQFYELKYGNRAMIKLINNYINAGHDTIRKILSRWVGYDTPQVNSYINFAKGKGYNDLTLDMPILQGAALAGNLFNVAKLITQKEVSRTITQAEFNTAYNLL